MMKFFCLTLLTIASLSFYSFRVEAQQKKIPEEPFQVVDASTGKTISEILVIPRYSSATGIFIVPEGPGKGIKARTYLDKPFVYRAGESFILKRPLPFIGLPLIPILIGKAKQIDGIFVVAPGYRPLWFVDLWWYPGYANYERKLKLTPISGSEWSLMLEKELSPLVKGGSRLDGNCRLWELPEPCKIKISYNKKDRELVRSFLREDKTKSD